MPLNYFEVFGLPLVLQVDEGWLRNAFYGLSKKVHPDRYAGRSATATAHALQWSTLVNRAYQTLRNRTSRSRYLVELLGGLTESETDTPKNAGPTDLAEAYFDLQDLMESDRTATESIAIFLGDLEAKLMDTRSQWESIAREWTPTPDFVARLKDNLSRERYLESMIQDLRAKFQLEPSSDLVEGT